MNSIHERDAAERELLASPPEGESPADLVDELLDGMFGGSLPYTCNRASCGEG
jgi:hypothetical protein